MSGFGGAAGGRQDDDDAWFEWAWGVGGVPAGFGGEVGVGAGGWEVVALLPTLAC